MNSIILFEIQLFAKRNKKKMNLEFIIEYRLGFFREAHAETR